MELKIRFEGLLFDVLGESSILSDTTGLEVFTKQRLSPTAIEASIALLSDKTIRLDNIGNLRSRSRWKLVRVAVYSQVYYTDSDPNIGNATVTDGKTFHVLAHFYYSSNSFVSRNELDIYASFDALSYC